MKIIKRKRLNVNGPDTYGAFELELIQHAGDSDYSDYCYLSREKADVLIVALGGTPPVKKQIRQLRKVRDI